MARRLGSKLLHVIATILFVVMSAVERALRDPLTWYLLGAALLAHLAFGLRPTG